MFCRKLCRYGLNLLLAAAISHGVYANAAEIDHRENQAEYTIYLDADGSHTPAMRRAAQENVVRATQAPPLSNDSEAGKGVRVAILSTGIDYTHALLGGDGTPAAYAEAFENRLTTWDAFRNGVVVDGFDAASEDGGVDPNPLEHAIADTVREQYPQYPIGRGTLLGSVIHQLAPGADLLAYKIWDIRSFDGENGEELFVRAPSQEVFDRAFTRVVDPDGDGDYSDRADIALIDTFGGMAYYNPYEERDSTDTTIIALVQALAAHGVLVVTDTGTVFPDSRFGISWIGAAPDTLTVGAMHEFEPGRYAAAPFAARGPVRGTHDLKPDLVSHGYDVTGARAGTATGTTTETSNNVAAARIAAAAAILKSARPELSSLDLKALLANTAIHDVLSHADSSAAEADVALIGLGREDINAALLATALVRSESGNQPSLNFGAHEFDVASQLVRSLVVRNLTDKDQVFTVGHSVRGDKLNNAAVTLEYPATVYVPAMRQVTIPVAVHVDPTKLQPWPLQESSDYTGDAWSAVQVNGYLTLTSAGAPDLSVAWMVTPRAQALIRKEFSTLEELRPENLDWIKDSFADLVTGLSQEFTNTGAADLELIALPLISERRAIPDNLSNSYGHILRHVSGGVFDEPSCAGTGRKFVIAATMHRPSDVAAAHYMDRAGDLLFFFRIVRNEAILNFGLDVAVNDEVLSALGDANHINYGFVLLDSQARPQTFTTNLNMEFDPANPTARYQQSSLPTYVAPHSRHAIAQFCVEDILHHDVTPDELDKNLGFVFSTDRDAFPKVNTPIIQFNPVKFGYVQADFFSSVNTGAKVSLGMASAEEELFSPTLTLPPGSTGKLTAIKDGACDGFGFGTPPPCARQFVLLDTNSDFSLLSEARTGDETALAFVRDGQDFSVGENAEADSLVGRIELDAENFFGSGSQPGSDFDTFRVYLAEPLPGNPVAVDSEGRITIANADAVDYEAANELILKVRTHKGMESTRAVDVRIHVVNVNDEAPKYLGGLEDFKTVMGAPIALQFAEHFEDIDGDPLSFSVTGLPNGIVTDVTTGAAKGVIASSGEFEITVAASDGIHDTSTSFTLSVPHQAIAPPPASPVRSGGGVSGLWLMALLLPFAVRLKRRWNMDGHPSGSNPVRMRAFLSKGRGQGFMMKSRLSLLSVQLICLIGTGLSSGVTNADSAVVDELAVERDRRPRYIVHLQDPPVAINAQRNLDARLAFTDGKLDMNAAVNRAYRNALVTKQRELEKAIHAVAQDAVITRRFQLALNAVVVEIDDKAAAQLRALPGVKRVERVVRHEMHTDRGPAHVRAPLVWAGLPGLNPNRGEGIIIGIIDSGIRPDHPSFADVAGDGYNHDNPWGENVYVGDCEPDKFPELCNDKLIGIVSYSEITDSFNGERPANGWDYHGHGTHVASTAAGNILRNVPTYNDIGGQGEYAFPLISGVAPRANIVAYQVCYPENGGCDTDLTVQAIDHAIDNGIDVLNYSVGGAARNPWEQADALAFLGARAAGIHVAVSTGNDGPEAGTVTSPGNSPWVTSVAAYTHDRGYSDPALTGFTGGENPPFGDLTGKGITNGARSGVVMAADFGDALCGEPFAAGTFRGAIVVCERGINPRVEKGRNVLAGGAGGMILINVPDCDITEIPDCATQTVTDFHELPAIHLDAASGEILRQWLSAGTNHIATITVGTPVEDDDAGNRAGVFTSRGPALPFGSIPSPRIAAPGVGIYAAWVEDAPFRDQEAVAPFRFLEGTSMASPHVAGALALLKGAHPDWTPAEAQSALMSTANPDTRSHDGAPSTLFDAGSGMLDIAAALNAGLLFDEQMIDDDGPDYLDTDPALGGSPADINMPAFADDACLLRCSWKRTVKAVRATSWNATTEQDEAMTLTVEPAGFTLAAGEELELTVTAELDGDYSGAWLNGRITLVPADSRISTASLPLAARFVAGSGPEYASLTARRNADRADIPGFRSVTTDDLQIDVKGLVEAETYEAFLHGDPTPSIPFDVIDNVVHVATATTTNRTRMLVAEILEADASDLDLYIARDANLDGKPNGAELAGGELCISASAISLERCVVRDPAPGVYWIAVQNFAASNPDVADRHFMTVALIEDSAGGLEVTAPGEIADGEPYPLHAEWNHDMHAGGTWYATIDVGTSPDSPGDIGRTLLRLDRVADDFHVAVDRTDLVAGGSVTYTWTIEPVATDAAAMAYRVSVEVPAGMTALADHAADIESDMVTWIFSQSPGAPQRHGTLTLTNSAAETGGELALPFMHSANSAEPVITTAPVITILPRLQALINGKANLALEVAEGEMLAFSAGDSIGSGAGIGFEWEQTAGTETDITTKGKGMFELRAPAVDADIKLEYELVVSLLLLEIRAPL